MQLSLPGDQLFADEAKPATASVLLGGGSEHIEPAQVRGIASLVAGAVEGLKKDKVTITDSSGNLLWPQGDGSDTGATMTKTQAEARYAAGMQAQLTAMLDKTVGEGKAQVTVRPDLDVDKTTQEKLTYAKTGTPLKQTKSTETLTGARRRCGRPGRRRGQRRPGTGANAAGTGSGSNYRKNDTSTDYGVNKIVERRSLAAGTVNRMDVAVLVDSGPSRTCRRSATRCRARRASRRRAATRSASGGRVRQARRDRRQGRPDPGRRGELRQVRRPGPRRPALPLLRHPGHPQARALLARRADLAVGDRPPRARPSSSR